MAKQFHGTLGDLKGKLATAGLTGEWQAIPNGIHRLVCKDKSGLNWSENKGTVWCDGPANARAALEKKIQAALADVGSSPQVRPFGMRESG